jgi:hypothetical protein
MKKEVFLAISMGFVLGLIITFGIWTANKSLKQSSPSTAISASPSPAISVSPTATPQPGNLSLVITAPENEALTASSTLTVTGKTSPNTTVALVYDLGDQIIQSDANGNFTTDITLEGGFNTISVTAFDTKGNQSTQSLTVTYTTVKI